MTRYPAVARPTATQASVPTSVPALTPCLIERNKHIEQYLPLVDSVLAKVRRNLPAHIDSDDLYSAGVTGLIAAAERYNPEQADSFIGYVRLRIRGAMLDELRRLDPSTRNSRLRARKIQVAVQAIEQAVGRAPTDQELSNQLKISPAELDRWRGRSAPVRMISLDGHPDDGSGQRSSLHELLPHDHEGVRETMEREELKELLTARIGSLPAQQKRILAFYYFEGMSYAEIGQALDLTESRICQIHKQAVGSLRLYIQSLRWQ